MGEPSNNYRKVHEVVLQAQAAAVKRMVGGMLNATQLDRVARGIIEKAGHGTEFVHRLGHGIGVSVHEPPFLYQPDDTTIRNGMTFTIEPSILLKGSWSNRVEDVVLVTEKGGEYLTQYSRELTVL
jgi:Xaa-Pro aminopeptidase